MSQEALDKAVRYVWLQRMMKNLLDLEADIEAGAEDESGEWRQIVADHVSAARKAMWPEYLEICEGAEGKQWRKLR